ncbi:hypothetical protein SISNIDRAFT_517630 [Sistotremastrum niveocremeum HHB9708]|uniref:Glycosyl transferase CAP10 domain-containing protein n=1 Tax=Sistotremastrum niveocremeum HHB9708 TaxID=1314777 RepID=A0A164RZT6_9AGAM|nr:hypothetical protein SISNIDRAFT_517630 [Sistotremastrum niveocremeum HHB9708]
MNTGGSRRPTEENIFMDNGLLPFNPSAPHPIPDLIAHSQSLWRTKQSRASRTLADAITEYKRRYHGRKPPKGFDKWWKYVERNNVQLPDEYDQIMRDLEPFYGIDPSTLLAELAKEEGRGFSYTLVSEKGRMSVEKRNYNLEGGDKGKPEGMMDFLRDVEGELPDFRAVFSVMDGSSLYLSWEHKAEAIKAARENRYVDLSKLPDPKPKGFEWPVICPPTTPINSPDLLETYPQNKSFIHSHLSTMSPCTHPSHAKLSGFYLSRREPPPRPARLIPVFVPSKVTIHEEILTVAPDQFWMDKGRDVGWNEKGDERIVWRGGNTGVAINERNYKELDWMETQRMRLIRDFSGERDGVEEDEESEDGQGGLRGSDLLVERVRTASLNAALVDVAFTGRPVQCDRVTCAILEKEYEFRKKQTPEEANRYKYFLDVDGNGWSARFRRLMSSNALVFKSTLFPEWFTDRIQPWVHYVPIKVDYTDLYDTLLFFRGDLNPTSSRGGEADGSGSGSAGGRGKGDVLAEEIANEGRDWVDKYWRAEDMTAYMYRLMLEYARVMSLDREAASYQGDH